MITAFKNYLLSLALSPISRKLYLSDVRRFLTWIASEAGVEADSLTLDQLSQTKHYVSYLASLSAQSIAPSMMKRTNASLRQFTSFLTQSYGITAPAFSAQDAHLPTTATSLQQSEDYIKPFSKYLLAQHLSPLTIKSYKSDITRYLDWAQENMVSTKIAEVLTDKNIEKYLNHLSESLDTLPSTIERKKKSIARIQAWYLKVYDAKSPSDNMKTAPYDLKPTFHPLSTPYSDLQPTTYHLPKLSAPGKSILFVKNAYSRTLERTKAFAASTKSLLPAIKSTGFSNYATLAILLVFASSLGIFGYRSFSRDTKLIAAYPSTPVTPNRNLSFQGRLEDSGGTPITVATDLEFKLWNDLTAGTQLYTTATCSITPDADGVFSTQIGSTCGSAIASSVFTENANIFLEVKVDTETLVPRQPISSVAYALNSETIQGFPISSTVSAIRNTVVPMNQWGEIIIGEQNPRMTGVSGNFQISAPSLTFSTTANGSIALSPNGTGQVNVSGGTTTTNFFNVSNSALTTGSLITGTVANANTGFKLLDLLSGSSPTSKFSVTDTGNTTMAGDLTVTGDDLFMNTNTAGYLLIADGTNFNPTAMTGDVTISGSGVTSIGSDRITEAMLKSVNGPTDELCLSYESTVGDFEWQTCGGSSSWTLAGDSGASQTISSTDTASIVGGTNGIDTVASATDTLTLNLDTTEINNATFGSGSGFTWTFDASGGTDTTLAFGNDLITATTASLSLTGDLTVTGNDITFGNGETISNATDGTLLFTSPLTKTSSNLEVAGTATISGVATIGNGTTNTIRSPYGPLSFDYKSGLDTWGTAMTIDDLTGYIGINNTAPSQMIHALQQSDVIGLDIMGEMYSSVAGNRTNFKGDRSRGTVGAAAIVQDGDALVGLTGRGFDGSAYQIGARLAIAVDGTPGSGDMPGRFQFFTTPDGSSTPLERMRINNAGFVGIGDTSPASMLTVGSGDLFQVNSSGIISNIDGVAHTIDDVTGDLTLASNSTLVNVNDDLKITGDDLFMTTNTAGYLLIADGTNFNPTAMSGDVTISGSGVTSVGSDRITEAMLKSVNGPTDELCLSYESTVGDFEWQTCGSGSNWSRVAGNLSPLVVGDTISATTSAAVALTLTQTGAFNALLVEDQASDTTPFVIDQSGNVGIGTATPTQQLEITGNFEMPNTTFADQSGIVYKSTSPFLHNFNYGNNGTVTTTGANTFLGISSGNLTMGSTATVVYQSSYNTAVGNTTLNGLTTGYNNTAMGYQALTGTNTGSNNSAFGLSSLRYNNSGSTNTALGYAAGMLIADGITANLTSDNSLYLGANTKALADNDQNEIVIGYNATGIGSNTVTLGADTITTTALKGNVGIGITSPNAKLDVAGTASVSGVLTLGNGTTNTLRSPYGPLTFDYKSGLNTWGTAMTVQDSTGYIGIGTTAPDSPLDVVGDVYISDGLSLFETAVSDGTVEATKFCTGDGETNCVTDFSALVAGSGYWSRTSGVLSPTTLNDVLAATTSATTALTLTQTGAFNALLVEDQASDTTPFVIDQSGNVGIGTTTPAAKLGIVDAVTLGGTASIYGTSLSQTLTGTPSTNIISYGNYSSVSTNVSDGTQSLTTYAGYAMNSLGAGNTIDTLYGQRGSAVINSDIISTAGNTATTSAGLVGLAYLSAAGTVTNQYGTSSLSYLNSVDGTITNSYGIQGQSFEIVEPTTGGVVNSYGGSFIGQDGTTSYGVYAQGIQNTTNTETFTSLYGTYSDCSTGSSTVTVTNCFGVRGNITETLGTITNGYAGYFNTSSALGSAYGVYANVTGASTTNYGIYSNVSGATTNYSGIFMGGNVGVGDATPASLLSVGNGDLFQVNSSGIIANIDGVAHTIDDVSGNLTLTSNGTSVVVADDLAVNGATSADITSTTATATVFDTTVTSLSLGGASTTLNMAAGGALARAINLGTGTGVDTINIGTGTTGADVITFGNTGAASTFTFNSGASTTNPLTFDFDTVTTGIATDLSIDGLTTGTGLLLDNNVASSLTTGTLLQAQSVATSLTTAGDAFLGYFNWNPGSATTATGDLFRINIGANGTATNLFNITDNGTSLFSVSETAVTSNIPTNFTSAGDVSMSYDLNFTNLTSSTIRSASQLYITAGETYDSSDMNLTTYNKGNIIANTEAFVTTGAATVSGTLRANGNTIFNGLTYAWPASHTTSGVLQNDGSGALTWATLGAAAISADSLDFTEFKDAMTLDASTDIAASGTNVLSITNTGTGNSFLVNDAAGDTTPFVIDQSGNVGIGNTTANAPLQIYSDTGTGTGAMYLGTGANASTMISAQGRAYFGYGAGGVAVVQGALTKGIQFNVNNNTFGSGEAMRIESTGLVGIGTAGPDAKLDVLSTTEQLRLTYADGTVYSSHTVDSSGNLTINNTGTQTIIADDLAVNGATSADITSTTATATVFDSTVTSLSLGGAATTLNMGAGGALARAINLGTGTGVDTINIGTGTTGADVITFGNTGAASTFTFNSGASTTNPLTFDFDTVTTGIATDLSIDGLTTGTGLLLDNNVASSLTTGTLLQAQSVATSLTTAGDAFLGYFNWNPGSATTAVGDLFRINIGANGTATNLFNLTDNSSSLFSVSETTVTSNLPTSFTSAGDVSMSYDLVFTNPTASNITSAAPLSIIAGETFNSSNLTLKTYNSGDVVIDAAGGVTLTQAQAWDLAASTTALNFESGLLNLDTTNSRIGIGTTTPSATLDVAGTASVSGVLTLGNGTTNTLRSPYGALNIDYKSGLNTWGTAMTVDDITGYVGIGTTTPRSKLTINAAYDTVGLDIGGGQIDTPVSSRIGEAGFGFDWYYDGSGSGDANYLNLRSDNANGTSFNIFKFGHTTSGLDIYGGYASTGITIAQSGDLTTSGKIGISNSAPIANLDITGTASVSGALTIGNAGVIRSGYDNLVLQYKSGLDTWATALSLNDITGYVSGNRYQSTTSVADYLDLSLSSGSNSLAMQGNILKNAAAEFVIASTSNNNITLDAGSGTVQVGAAGAGKLDAATIDPPYTINGNKYATYMASMTGVKEETTGNIYASEYISGTGYRATLDLASSPDGSDIWLFGKTTNLKHNLDKMVVLLSAAGNTKTWYDIDATSGKLHLYSLAPTTISYRLTAPRYDAQNWLNTRDIGASAGLIVDDTASWSVSSAIADAINAGKTTVASIFGNVETNLISPLDTTKEITITAPVAIKPTSNVEPALTVDGEILAATISARTAILNDVQAETITAKNIVADTITANHIEGLDARIASLSGKLSDQDITSITDRIKNRLDILTGNLPTASDLPTPVDATSSAILDTTTQVDLETSIASGSAILSSLSADFATINGYLAVIGQATMTDVDVTNILYTGRIDSKTGTINLANNTLIVDSTGSVAINGDLIVTGKVLAESASLNTLELGTPAEATSSALGQLLSIYNESGVAVATIDASGSANLASLTTNMITISGGTDATSSALLTSSINSSATAGVSTMISPDTELTISSPYVTKDTLVYLTPTTNTQNKVLFVKSKNTCDNLVPDIFGDIPPCTPSFTIAIDAAASSDISFNWWIIQLGTSVPN